MNPRAFNLFAGLYDTTAGCVWPQRFNAIDSVFQGYINSVKNKPSFKFFRFYGQTGDDGACFYLWDAWRYLNRLVGGMMNSEMPNNYSQLYQYHIEPATFWGAIKLCQSENALPVPYYKYGDDFNPLFFGFKHGWASVNNLDSVGHHFDTLNSAYETNLPFGDSINRVKDLLYYNDRMREDNFFQSEWEHSIYDNFFDKTKNYYLYSGRPWWVNFFIGSGWGNTKFIDNTTGLWCAYLRPKTGEEIKLIVNSELVRGAKGFCYDRDFSDTIPWLTGCAYPYVIDNYPLDSNFIYRDEIGKDFIDTVNDACHFDRYIKFDQMSNLLHVNKTRMYIGHKSTRLELLKIHDFVNANDSVLMKLKLVCNYSKGFRIWYNQDTARFSLNIMDNIIDTNNIKTRPIGRIHSDGTPFYEQESGTDSAFYDITLLRLDTDTLLNTNAVYLGVQNRRVDHFLQNL